MSNIGTATSGTVLQGAGSGNAPKFSTATYPSTAGTSGNVLTSDGTNWNSTAPSGGLLVVSGTLTNSQIKNLHGTPVQIIAAPGAGKVVLIVAGALTLNYGGTNIFVAGAGQFISFTYGTTISTGIILSNAAIVSASSQYVQPSATVSTATAYTNVANVAINAYNGSATEISGNAANDNTVSYNILYRIITIP